MLNQISFGRAVKVNAPIEVANKIVKSANSSIPVSRFDMFTKSIFDDTNITKAKVVPVAPDEIYIFSGEEAKQQTKILQDLKEKINKNNELISCISDETTREKRENKIAREKYKDVYYAIFKMRKMIENGKKGRPCSIINVKTKTVKIPLFGNYNVIDTATYTSRKRSKVEKLEYKSLK